MPRGIPNKVEKEEAIFQPKLVEKEPEWLQPEAIKLYTQCSFVDEDGIHFVFPAGRVIRNPFSIAMILDRNVKYMIVKED